MKNYEISKQIKHILENNFIYKCNKSHASEIFKNCKKIENINKDDIYLECEYFINNV